jgi:hypothetical protein
MCGKANKRRRAVLCVIGDAFFLKPRGLWTGLWAVAIYLIVSIFCLAYSEGSAVSACPPLSLCVCLLAPLGGLV